MKRLTVLLLALVMLIAAACAQTSLDGGTVELGASPDADPVDMNTQAPVKAGYGLSPQVKVMASVAYLFEGEKGSILYGAAEYKNTGDCPVTVSNASFEFNLGGSRYKEETTPALNAYDIVLPGETSYVAAWIEKEDIEYKEGNEVAVSVQLSPARSLDTPLKLTAGKLYIAQNYPGFCTLSGSLTNESMDDCDLNMIYSAFYDKKGDLLGVWNFSKNVLLAPGDEKAFVVHMRALPIPDLAQNTSEIKTVGFGIG